MKVGQAFLQTFAVQVTQTAMSIATGILIARGLGPDGQGRYAVFAAAVGLGVILGSLGQFESNVLTSEGRLQTGRVLLTRSFIQSGTLALALFVTLPLWHAAFGSKAVPPVLVFFPVVLALEVEAQLLRGVNLGQHRIAAFNLSTLMQRLVYLLGVLLITVSGHVSLAGVLGGWAGATAVSVAVTALWAWRRSDVVQITFARLLADWGAAFRRGMRALLTIATSLMLVRCDIWMLGPLLGVSTVGQMSVAVTLAEWLWYVPYILGNILFAAVAADKESRAARQVCRAARGVVGLVAPLSLALVIWGSNLVPLLYGRAYTPAGGLLQILAPGMAAIAVHIVVDTYFAGQGFPAISVWSAVGALVAKVGLNLLVIPVYGASGAAAVTVGVYTALLLVKVYAFTRATGLPVSTVLVPTRDDVIANLETIRLWVKARLGFAA